MRIEHWYILAIIPVLIYFFYFRRKKTALKFSNIDILKTRGESCKYKHLIGKSLILLGCIILVIALARPRAEIEIVNNNDEGIDIVMLLDVSGSMESVDFKPNRLEVAKETIINFVDKRVQDRIALVLFGGNAFTRIPLTLDHEMVNSCIKGVNTDSVRESGTAIGMSISVGMNRLKKSDSASKIMILVTDGDNNSGSVDPITASELAKDMGIKIYTIGVGTDKTILPVNYFGTIKYKTIEGGLNEELLKDIADRTGGSYFRAKDMDALNTTFQKIDSLEKTDFENDSFKQYKEYAFILMKVALIIIAIGLFIDRYYFIRIP